MSDLGAPRRANVIGLGLIGGSIAAGLRQRGWRVAGDDADPTTVDAAVERGVALLFLSTVGLLFNARPARTFGGV